MITIKNVKMLDDQIIDYTLPATQSHTIEANGKLLLLPGMIDPHIFLGANEKENQQWSLDLSYVIQGGFTTLIDIPSKSLESFDKSSLERKDKIINERLISLNMPIPYFLYAEAHLAKIDELGRAKKLIKGIVINLDLNESKTLDDRWERVFQIAAWEDLPVIVNAYHENARDKHFLEKAIYYAERQNTRLYVLNVATQEEIDLIQKSRKRSLLIYAETTPYHLFQQPESKANCLWAALNENIIETLGSGYHAEQTEKDRVLFRGNQLSFSNPAFFLPRLLTAQREGKISLEKIIRLTRFNLHDIFKVDKARDLILVDLEKEEIVQKIDGDSPVNISLKGWPVYTIVNGHIFQGHENLRVMS